MSVIPALFEYYESIEKKNFLSNIEYFFTHLEGDLLIVLKNILTDEIKWNNILALKSCYIEMLPSKQSQNIVFSKFCVDVTNIDKQYLDLFDKLFISCIFAYANNGDLSNLNLLLYKYENYLLTYLNNGFLSRITYFLNISDKSTKLYLNYLKDISTLYSNGIIQEITNQELLNIYNQVLEYKFNFTQEEFCNYFIQSKIKYLKSLITKEIYRCIFEFENSSSQYLNFTEIQDILVNKFQIFYEEKYGLPSMLDKNDNIEVYNLDVNESITDYRERVKNIQNLIKDAGLQDLTNNTVEIISIIDILELIILNGMFNNAVIRPDIKDEISNRLIYLSGRYNSHLILEKITKHDIPEYNDIFTQIFENNNL